MHSKVCCEVEWYREYSPFVSIRDERGSFVPWKEFGKWRRSRTVDSKLELALPIRGYLRVFDDTYYDFEKVSIGKKGADYESGL